MIGGTNRLASMIALLLLLFMATKDISATTSYKVHFLPVTFAMACDASTPPNERKYYQKSSKANAGIAKRECADTHHQLTGVKPKSIGVIYDDRFDTFEVVIHLNAADAKALHDISRNVPKAGVGKRILIGSDNRIVVAGFLNAPFEGDEFHIGTTSHEAAHDMARLFVDSITKK